MKKIFKPIILVVFVVLIPFYLKGFLELILFCLKNLQINNVQSFCIGLGLGLGAGLLSMLFSRHRDSIWLVFEHELTHLVVGKLCGTFVTGPAVQMSFFYPKRIHKKKNGLQG
jgi:hypothetical protein